MINENILAPLNMKNTFYEVPAEKTTNTALGVYGGSLTKRNIRIPYPESKGKGYKVPSGGLFCTPNDLARFMLALMDKSENKIIGEENLNLMESEVIQIDTNLYYGLGLYINKTQDNLLVIGHGGRTSGFNSFFCFDPVNNNGVVLMRNYYTGNTNFDVIAMTLMDQLANK